MHCNGQESMAHSSCFLLLYFGTGPEYVAVALLTLSVNVFYQDPYDRFLAPLHPKSKVKTSMQTHFHSIVVESLIRNQHLIDIVIMA